MSVSSESLPEIRGGTSPHPWRAFSLLGVAYFMTAVDMLIVNVALPTIGTKLHFAQTDLQWVVTAYAITFGGFLLLGGRMADLLGRRRMFMAGLVVFSLASLCAALATNATFLILMRGVQGLGAAAVLPAALSIVTNMFPEGPERNKALGIWGAVGASGATFGVLAGGLLTRYAGWQYIFYLNVVIGGIALLLTMRLVPESRLVGAPRSYDPLGAVTVTAASVLAVYAVTQAPIKGWTSTRTVTELVVAAVLLIAFVVIESRSATPLLPLRLFRLSTLAGSNAVGFMLGASFYGYIFIGTLYMQQVLHYSAMTTGLAWLTVGMTGVVMAGPSQVLVNKLSVRVVMAAGLALTSSGILWATQAPVDGSFWANLAGPFFLTGAVTWVFIPVSIGALVGVKERDTGIASGLIDSSQQLGGAVGIAIASTVAASRLGTLLGQGHNPTDALTGGFHQALLVCGLIGMAAVPVAVLFVRNAKASDAALPAQGKVAADATTV
ncbi:major facilitator superfamily MFS_1 [Catenulispora acidiphila DSM 44928]|uniref:Major facilitator superfamily MFS_1 n=1 Tax=Catenulispora acidiphila (strain DSM 44928 / JCM 14897 / NBRC 102108 / NRRL B-24433 / ID139908) TaxID=479433 RepID=C7Q9T1_CATAD|nr:MFS transporter [Catenulispora acidiphila]ACU76250.1 major facilitator superfamily MFS_1 [Catenulispora acidiphila DSM 44928]